MNKKLILVLMLSSVMLLSLGCQSKSVEPKEEAVVEIIDKADENVGVTDEDVTTEIVTKSTPDEESKKSSAQVMDEFETIKAKSAFDMLRFVDENIEYTDSTDADTLVTNFISKSMKELESSNNYLYGEDSIKINDLINKTLVFDGDYSIFADKKDQLINAIEDEVIKTNLSEIFERGQGLVSSEGSYYAVVDYIDLYSKYGKMVSSSLSDYLEIASIETKKPSTNEEYLAISIDELKIRAIRYEEFLKNNGNAPYAGEVRMLYMTCLWKIVNPSIFDGQLNDDFTVIDDMLKLYDQTKDLVEYPVLKDAVNGILDFIDSREGGVVGSFEDSDELFENARMLHENASNQIDKLYMNK